VLSLTSSTCCETYTVMINVIHKHVVAVCGGVICRCLGYMFGYFKRNGKEVIYFATRVTAHLSQLDHFLNSLCIFSDCKLIFE